MRKVIVSNFASLDGFMAGPKGELDWFSVSPDFFDYCRDLLGTVDAILFGRVTYEGMAAYWPTATSSDSILADGMNETPKIVFSRTLERASWGKWDNARVINGNITDEISRLKHQPGKDMVIYGSGSIVYALTEAGLIDEYQMVVSPVVIGKGKPAFGVHDKLKLKLLKTQTFDSGSILLCYGVEK